MLNNRQGNNNRRRGRNNNSPRPQGNGPNRNGDNGNRIDSRARGNAPQLLEKYKALARDAQMAGDRVLTEYYHQFADHYFRVVAETRSRFEDNRRPREDWDANDGEEAQVEGRNGYDDGDEDDQPERTFNDNRSTNDNRGNQAQPRQPQAREDREERPDRGERQNGRDRAYTPQNERTETDDDQRPAPSSWEARAERAPREDRPAREPRQPRFERQPRESQPRESQPRDTQPRDDQPRDNQPRNERPARRPRFSEQSESFAAQPEAQADAPLMLDLAVLPPAIAPMAAPELDPAPDAAAAPKKRGRPRKVVAEADAG